MAGIKGQKSGGHSTKGVAGRKKEDSPLREGKQIRVSSELLEKLKEIPGKTWNDKIDYLLIHQKAICHKSLE